MPYKVGKRGNKWVVYNPDTGKVYGKHDSKPEADDQKKALWVNSPPSKEHRKDKRK